MFKLPFMILFFFSFVVAQSPSVDMPVCTDEFAKFLVEQQVAESASVQETDKRVRILTRSADFLWKFDQPKSREYFTTAFKVANDRFNEKGFEKTEQNGMTTLQPDYRFEVIKAIAKHDSEWARKLTEQLLKEYEAAAADRKGFDRGREITDVVQLAIDNSKTNPSFTLYLLRRVMRETADYHWHWGLFSVAISNQALADQIYGELLVNYANESPRRMLFLSAYPFGNERTFGIDKFQSSSSVPDGFVPNTDLQIRFIDTFFRRVRSFALDPDNLNRQPEQYRQPESVYMVSALQDIEPIVIQSFPAYIQRLSEAKAQAASLLNEETRAKMGEREKQNQTYATSFEQRIERLEKAEEEEKLTDAMILNLLISRPTSEEQFKQVEPWIEKMKDEEARRNSLNYFWFLRSELAVKEDRLAEAEKFAAMVPEFEHRSILAFQIAEKQLKSVNDLATIFQTLNDVGKLARQSPNSVTKAKILLALSSMYEKVNHSFAIDELSEAVRVINRLENANLLTGSVHRTIKTKDMSFFAVFSLPTSGLESTFLELSKNDFDLALSNAKALEDKFYRTLAVLAVAKNCINRLKPKTKKATPKK